ncbi:MAG: NFACT RNA binding domain-containing protein [Raineya sp.]|nr:NFACT RNA binding domain-containing protein [Raineya sp.]
MMHQNYYFLRAFTQEIEPVLRGMELITCFSQNKDEIVFGFGRPHQDLYIRATLQGDFACFHTLEEFHRAKKNTIELFETAIGKQVTQVKVMLNDRSWAIFLKGNLTLLFKMYGNRANVLLFENDEVIDIFHKKLQNDWNLKLSEIPKPIEQTWENFCLQNHQIKAIFPTFDKHLLAQIQADSPQEIWQKAFALHQKLLQPKFFVGMYQYLPALSLLEGLLENAREYTSAVKALNEFYYAYMRVSQFTREHQQAIRQVEKLLEKTENYLQKTYQKWQELQENRDLEKIGHLLMANLHQIPDKAERITLTDFYTEKPITIKLKPELSPQKNAEWYYKKAKNQKIELAKLEENLQARELYRDVLQNHLEKIKAISSLKELRNYLKENKLDLQDEKNTEIIPFKVFEIEGFKVLVGKNAQNNDLLTQKYAYKEDLWLHAKDVTGSHVIIKYQSGKNFPKSVIEKAAQLAAYFSKRRNETLCPVIVTPKKFVRKTKDLDAGQVIVEKENVVMVEPLAPEKLL